LRIRDDFSATCWREDAEASGDDGGALGEESGVHGETWEVGAGTGSRGTGFAHFAFALLVMEVAEVLVAKGKGAAGFSRGHDVSASFHGASFRF